MYACVTGQSLASYRTYSFIHSWDKYLLSSTDVPGNILVTGDTVMNKTDNPFAYNESLQSNGRQYFFTLEWSLNEC